MQFLRRTLMLLLFFVPSFLDVVSCNPQKSTIDIYNYDGEEFVLEHHIVKGRYEEYFFPEVDTSLEGYTFLAWLEVYDAVEFKILDELKEAENIHYLVRDTLPESYRQPLDKSYYPLIIKNEELVEFIETSPLSKVNVEVCFVFGDEPSKNNYTALLTDTYQDVLLGELEKEGYTYLGISKTYKSDYLETGLDDIELLNLEDRFVFDGYNRIYVYYEKTTNN